METKIRNIILIIIFGGIFLPVVFAQVDVDKAVREVDRSLLKESEEKLKRTPEEIEEIKTEDIKESKEGQVFIKKIKLVGCESIPSEVFASVLEAYENKRITLDDLNILAKEIEREYLRQGIIAACFVPAQEIREGVASLQIIEAKFGKLNIEDHKYFKKERINYYWKISPEEVLSYNKLSRSLQAINKNPDREVKATLHAGEKPQTTDVQLKVNTSFPFHVTSTFDKEGAVATGVDRMGLGIRHNNFLGFDDTLLGGRSFGHTFNGIYTYHRIPINSYGSSLMYGFSYSKSFPKKEYESYRIDSRAKNYSVTVYHDIFDDSAYLGEIYWGLEAKDKTVKMMGSTTNRDRLRIFKAGSSLNYKNGGSGITYVTPEISKGINLLGADRKSSLSSRGAKNTFTKCNLGVQHKRLLPLNWQASFKVNSQISSTKLASQEEFSLGGINSVRGYPSGDYLADKALQTNVEVLVPVSFIPEDIKIPYSASNLRDDTTVIFFFDYGYGKRKGADATEKKTCNLRSLGAGIRVRLFEQALLRLEWGFPFGDDTITEDGDSRFHFSLDFQDQLPEEIERIKNIVEEKTINQYAWELLNEEFKREDSFLKEKLKISHYWDMVEMSYKEGKLEESKKYCEQIVKTSEFLHNQLTQYVKVCFDQQKKLKDYEEMAIKYYKEGDFIKAKEIWNQLLDEAKIQPLIVEF